MRIRDDVWVTVRYRLFDSLGDAIEPTERELTYLQGGYGSVFPRIEQALAGHSVGYTACVYLEPEESFGDYDPDLVRLAPRDQFPEELELGMTFEGAPGGAQSDQGLDGMGGDDEELYIVTDFTEDTVVLDANHPLAGMSLRFDLRVVEVREASQEEIDQERQAAREFAEADPGASRAVAAHNDSLDDDDDADDDGIDIGPGRGDRAGDPRRLH